jgi:hypothetical protein
LKFSPKVLLFALSVAGLSAAVPTCTVGDISGTYSFYVNGSLLEPGTPLTGPFSRIGYFIADGKGGLKISALALYNGISFGPDDFTGTYSVTSDCTYSMVANVGAPVFAPSPASGQIAAGGHNIVFMAVGVPSTIVAFAQRRERRLNSDGEGSKCSTADLKGAYRMEINGFLNLAPGSNGTAYRQVGSFRLDGKGGLLAAFLTSHNGPLSQETGAGTYTVNGDCTFDMAYQIGRVNYGIRGTIVDSNKAYIALNMPGVPAVIIPGIPSIVRGAVATGTMMRQ